MKKILVIMLCTVLCVTATACGGDNAAKVRTEEMEAAKAAAEGMSTDIKSGEFKINEKTYTFPMEVSEFTKDGWHISDKYENKDEFKVKPGAESSSFELYDKENETYVTMKVLNLSAEEAPIEECMVSYIQISLTFVDAVLPGGICKANSLEDVEAAYGEADEKEEKVGYAEYSYELTNNEEYKGQITISIQEDAPIHPCTGVEYYLEDVASNGTFASDYTEDMSTNEIFQTYVDSSMKVSYHGDFTESTQLGLAEEEAKAIYESCGEYFADAILDYWNIEKEYVEQETYGQYVEFAKQVLGKTKWEFKNAFMTNMGYGNVEIDIYPTNLFEVSEEALQAATATYEEKYANIDKTTVSEEERTAMETEYAKLVLEAVEGVLEQVYVKEAVNKTLTIYDNNLTSEQWEEIDGIIMGLK